MRAIACSLEMDIGVPDVRASPRSQPVALFVNRQEVVDAVIADPLVSIASDGELGHPRNAGTYCQILARYVRDLGP